MRDDLREIRIAHIKVRDNVRHGELDVADLAADIRANGLLQPLLVRRTGDGYELVAGHRRLAACQELHMESVPCLITDGHGARRVDLQLAENIQRQDLSPYDVGLALRRMRDSVDSIHELARRVRMSYPWVAHRLDYADLYDDLKAEGVDEALLRRIPCDTLVEFKAVPAADRAELVRAILPADPEKAMPARGNVRKVLQARLQKPRAGRKKPLAFDIHEHGLVLTLEFKAKLDARRVMNMLLERGGRMR